METANPSSEELVNIFKRTIHDIGEEEVRWLVNDKDWKLLYETMMDICKSLYNKNQSYTHYIKNRDYEMISNCLTRAAMEFLKIEIIKCPISIIEKFYSEWY